MQKTYFNPVLCCSADHIANAGQRGIGDHDHVCFMQCKELAQICCIPQNGVTVNAQSTKTSVASGNHQANNVEVAIPGHLVQCGEKTVVTAHKQQPRALTS